MYACISYPWYFFLTYLPNYLDEQYGVAKGSELAGLAKGGPLILGAVGCIVGGWLTDRYVRRTGDRRWEDLDMLVRAFLRPGGPMLRI